jgi:DNA polymerase-3 subunit alpha
MFDMLFGQTETQAIEDQSNQNKRVEQRPESLPQRLLWEKELLGIYISGHPLDKYKHLLENAKINIAKLNLEGIEDKVYDQVLGIIEGKKEIATKKDATKKMVFFKLKDLSGEIECVVFPKQFEELKMKVNDESIVLIKGKISIRDDKRSIVVESIKVSRG